MMKKMKKSENQTAAPNSTAGIDLSLFNQARSNQSLKFGHKQFK